MHFIGILFKMLLKIIVNKNSIEVEEKKSEKRIHQFENDALNISQ